jgi:hypothetical protein
MLKSREEHFMRKLLIVGAVIFGGLVIAQAIQKSLNITINGTASSEKAIVVAGKSYVPLAVLKSLGVNAVASGNTLALSRAGSASTTPAKPSDSGAAGTQQLSGGLGVLGKAATLGKLSPLNFTLRSLEFLVGRVAIGQNVWVSNAKQKLLLVRFTAQNPQSGKDVQLNNASFVFTVVDSNSVSVTPDWAGSEIAIARDNDFTPVDTALKPGQRLDVYTVFVVPNDVSVPKLLVERWNERQAGVLRFDLSGKIKPLTAPFAADSTGIKSLEQINAQIGTYYPVGKADMRLESAQISTLEVGGVLPSEGKRFVRLIFGFRNPMPRGAPNTGVGMCGAEGFILEFTDSQNERQVTSSCGTSFLKVNRNENGDVELTPGQEVKLRYFFEIPNDVAAAKLMVYTEPSIRYVYDIGSAK